MVNYRRIFINGGRYFFTVTLKNRRSLVLTENINALRDSFAQVKQQQPFDIIAIVILPDHLHCIWQLPEGECNYSGRWRGIKSAFTHQIIQSGIKLRRNRRGAYNLWQSRFWEHVIRDDEDLKRHIDYIHYNPVKHGYVKAVSDWPFSSFHKFVANNQIEANWGDEVIEIDQNFGE